MDDNSNNAFASHNHGGKNVSGQVNGENITIVQGNYNASDQSPTNSSSSTPQSKLEDRQQLLENTTQTLKDIYLTRFRTINPFSLPFTFDIENTWVSLALEKDKEGSQATEDHAKLLKRAFDKEKMLIIEGNPATGKTSLMRRLAYEWASQEGEKQRTANNQWIWYRLWRMLMGDGKHIEALSYDLIIYTEFRDVREKEFVSIAQMVLYYCKNLLNKKNYKNLKKLMNNESFCTAHRVLVLLDGYDESLLKKQCSELNSYLFDSMIDKPLLFNVVIATRKGYLSNLRGRKGRFVFAQVLGFTTEKQKEKYISNHFSSQKNSTDNINAVHRLLGENQNLDKLAETPLFLTFICLVHERITDGSSAEALLNLYCSIVWYLLDRYQKSVTNNNNKKQSKHQQPTTKLSVPKLFEYDLRTSDDNWNDDDHELIIQNKFFHFPQLHLLGLLGLHNIEKTVFLFSDLHNFKVKEIVEAVGLIRKEEKRNSQNQRITEFFFPHRTIQEFLAAFSFFFSNEKVSYGILKSKLYQSNADVNEFRMFLRLFAETKTIPVEPTRQQEYLEWIKKRSLSNVQAALYDIYQTRFCKTNLYSLPFTCDIEKTWVSLALREDLEHSKATDDYATFLKRAFEKANVLIIEGEPRSGKTSLMQRLAYEWAKGKQELSHYDLVVYAELREVREEIFESSTDFALAYLRKYILSEVLQDLKFILAKKDYYQKHRILLLFDGYDKLCSEKLCKELRNYFSSSTIQSSLFFNIVLTTRPGVLIACREDRGYVSAEVLELIAKQQKEKYIFNHFLSSEIDNKPKIAAVHHLLDNSENLNKLAETPLFLTFICLVHERIVDGTLLELYCNIIWWLIDRHQQDNPDRDVPALFELENNSAHSSEPLNIREKQNIIQKHYLQFPQLLSLGKMALNNLKKDIFQETDFLDFDIKPIVHHVGLIRKDELYDKSWNQKPSFCFPHRTIQEFFAAWYCFCSDDQTRLSDLKLDTEDKSDRNPLRMNEFSRFLLRIALCDKIPKQTEKSKYYFERIVDIELDITFDAFNAIGGFNNKLLNWFLSQCTNVQSIILKGNVNNTRYPRNMLNDESINNETVIVAKRSSLILLSFSNLIKLHSLKFGGIRLSEGCTFSAHSQLSFTNCPSLKILQFSKCELKSSTNLSIATGSAIYTVQFNECTFSANSQLSFTNCPSLKNLQFWLCGMKSSTIVGIAPLPAIDTVQFNKCTIDLATWQSITDQICKSTVKYLKLSADFFVQRDYPEFLYHFQKCERIQQIDVKDYGYILHGHEKSVTANLAETAQKLPALTTITISDWNGRLEVSKRLSERNRERIEKAGQERNPQFSIKYVE